MIQTILGWPMKGDIDDGSSYAHSLEHADPAISNRPTNAHAVAMTTATVIQVNRWPPIAMEIVTPAATLTTYSNAPHTGERGVYTSTFSTWRRLCSTCPAPFLGVCEAVAMPQG